MLDLKVSVTPIALDMTHDAALERLTRSFA